jgi:hypothetical protein
MNNKQKKLSFDYDGTLCRKDVQEYAISLVNKGYDVWIVTSRMNTENALAKGFHWVKRQNEELYKVAEKCGIPIENIYFTEHIDKIVFLKDKQFIFHIDDSVDELMYILESGDSCKPVNVEHSDWLIHCNEILDNHESL